VQVDLSKPLLSKFRFHRRVWRIQYEGIKFICFHCAKVGDREELCPIKASDMSQATLQLAQNNHHDPTKITPLHRPEYG